MYLSLIVFLHFIQVPFPFLFFIYEFFLKLLFVLFYHMLQLYMQILALCLQSLIFILKLFDDIKVVAERTLQVPIGSTISPKFILDFVRHYFQISQLYQQQFTPFSQTALLQKQTAFKLFFASHLHQLNFTVQAQVNLMQNNKNFHQSPHYFHQNNYLEHEMSTQNAKKPLPQKELTITSDAIYHTLLQQTPNLYSINKFKSARMTNRNIFPDALSYPDFFNYNLVSNGRVIKKLEGSQAVIRGFYYQLMKLTFQIQVEGKDFVEIVKNVIFSPDFMLQENPSSPSSGKSYSDLQFKKIIAQFMEIVINQGIPNFQLTLLNYPIVDEALVKIMQKLLQVNLHSHPSLVKNIPQNQLILETLCQVFQVTMVQYNNCYKFEESDIFLYEHLSNELYLAFLNQMAQMSDGDGQTSSASFNKQKLKESRAISGRRTPKQNIGTDEQRRQLSQLGMDVSRSAKDLQRKPSSSFEKSSLSDKKNQVTPFQNDNHISYGLENKKTQKFFQKQEEKTYSLTKQLAKGRYQEAQRNEWSEMYSSSKKSVSLINDLQNITISHSTHVLDEEEICQKQIVNNNKTRILNRQEEKRCANQIQCKIVDSVKSNLGLEQITGHQTYEKLTNTLTNFDFEESYKKVSSPSIQNLNHSQKRYQQLMQADSKNNHTQQNYHYQPKGYAKHNDFHKVNRMGNGLDNKSDQVFVGISPFQTDKKQIYQKSETFNSKKSIGLHQAINNIDRYLPPYKGITQPVQKPSNQVNSTASGSPRTNQFIKNQAKQEEDVFYKPKNKKKMLNNVVDIPKNIGNQFNNDQTLGTLYRQFTNTKVLEILPETVQGNIRRMRRKFKGYHAQGFKGFY